MWLASCSKSSGSYRHALLVRNTLMVSLYYFKTSSVVLHCIGVCMCMGPSLVFVLYLDAIHRSATACKHSIPGNGFVGLIQVLLEDGICKLYLCHFSFSLLRKLAANTEKHIAVVEALIAHPEEGELLPQLCIYAPRCRPATADTRGPMLTS